MSFLYGAGFYPISQFNQIYNTPANLHNYCAAKKRLKDYIPIPEHVWDDPQYMSPCKHPNRLSYKLIAEGLYTDLYELYFKDWAAGEGPAGQMLIEQIYVLPLRNPR